MHRYLKLGLVAVVLTVALYLPTAVVLSSHHPKPGTSASEVVRRWGLPYRATWLDGQTCRWEMPANWWGTRPVYILQDGVVIETTTERVTEEEE